MVNAQRIGLPLGTRVLAIDTVPHGWRLWLGTRDFVYGDFIDLHHSGRVERIHTFEDEGDMVIVVKEK